VVWERRAPLARTLEVTNHRSLNLYAECLIKTLGRLDARNRLHPGGSWKAGAEVVRAVALEAGAKPGEVTVDDGSGLSRGNALSARAIVAVLRHALSAETGSVFYESLAGPGLDGTLRRRLTRLPKAVTVRGKTGTLTGVGALSGVLDGPGGERWLFSILANGRGANRKTLDQIVTVLAGHLARGG
jgi:D-alanyl-D-alanine carboxypeptidase/D-alanyl-D-alanine-endopeptidase (penicillin-binding protein 4)